MLTVVLVLLALLIQVARMLIKERKRPDIDLSADDLERMVEAVQHEARTLERRANALLTSDVRKAFLRKFWDTHDKVMRNLNAGQVRQTVSYLVTMTEIGNRITDDIERGRFSGVPEDSDMPDTLTQLLRSYCDRVMRLLGPHLRRRTINQLEEGTGRRAEPHYGDRPAGRAAGRPAGAERPRAIDDRWSRALD
jgi:hypothetical protein